jgi:hypothetical protein
MKNLAPAKGCQICLERIVPGDLYEYGMLEYNRD